MNNPSSRECEEYLRKTTGTGCPPDLAHLAEDANIQPGDIIPPKRKRTAAHLKMTQHRMYGKYTLERRYCSKPTCRRRYFVVDGKLDCDCPSEKSVAKRFDLKAWREEHGLTQVETSKLFGCGQSMIAKIERGVKDLPKHYLKKLKRLKKEGFKNTKI